MVMFSWKGGRQLTRKEIAREERRGKRVEGEEEKGYFYIISDCQF